MIMKKLPGIIPCALFLGILNLAVWTSVCPVTVRAGDLPHGPLTRPGSDWSKALPAGDWADKDGELGDAAAGSDRYDMLRCDLDLKIDPEIRFLEGSVKMVFSSLEAGLADMVFDLRYNFTVVSVTHATGPLAFTHDADSVSVAVPVPLAAGAVDSFVVSYSGFPRQDQVINRGLMFKTHRRLPDGPPEDTSPIIANVSQPGYAPAWWPCKDKPGDKFLMTMRMTVPDTLFGVSNGTLVSNTAADPGWRTYAWREDHLIASSLVSVAISDYVLLEEDCLTTGLGSFVPLKHWVFLNDVEDALIDFEPVCEMMDFCESRFGAYPFLGEKYGHAEFIWPGAMEHQTVTSISHAALLGDGRNDWLIVHELAHQWFGDSLTPRTWANIWLNEGFATYTEALWFEFSTGFEVYLDHLEDYRNEFEWASQGPVYDPVPIFPGRVIYDKGAWILHSLRGRMGDAPFFGLMQEWAAAVSRRDGYVLTQEFIDLASQWAGETLDDFLWPYLNETVLPQVSIDYQVHEGNAGAGTGLTVTLRQHQSPLFDNVFPLAVTTSSGSTTRRIPLNSSANTVELEFSAPVTEVVLDPERWVIWNEFVPGPAPQGLSNIYPNPSAGGYVVFAYHLSGPAHVQVRVMNAMGGQIVHHDLGTVQPTSEENEYAWDVRTGRGERAPSGIYWAAVEIDGQRHVGKFSVVR